MTEKMQFDSHLPNLLREAVEGHPTPGPLTVAVNITTPIIAALAERAIVLDDPELNVLCLRLGLYEIDARDRPAAIEAQKARGPRAQVSDHCAINGCIHNAHGCPTWPAGTNPFASDATPAPTRSEPVDARTVYSALKAQADVVYIGDFGDGTDVVVDGHVDLVALAAALAKPASEPAVKLLDWREILTHSGEALSASYGDWGRRIYLRSAPFKGRTEWIEREKAKAQTEFDSYIRGALVSDATSAPVGWTAEAMAEVLYGKTASEPAGGDVRDDMARAIGRVDGVELDWITDQTNPRWVKYRKMADAALAALSPSAAPAEPFGYVVTTGRGRDYFQRDTPETHALGADWTVTSVYAHPAPAPVESAVVAEREACAKVAEGLPGQRGNSPEHLVGRRIAIAIRDRAALSSSAAPAVEPSFAYRDENGDIAYQSAHPAPATVKSSLVTLDRDLVERAQHQLSASHFPFDRCVAAEISAALAPATEGRKS